MDGPSREGIATAFLVGSNGTSSPFVRAPAEDRSKYEKLIHDFEDVSSDDSHTSQPEAGNVLYFVAISYQQICKTINTKTYDFLFSMSFSVVMARIAYTVNSDYLCVGYPVCGLFMHKFYVYVDMCELGFQPLPAPYSSLWKG
jgi:hypothetical protein